MADARDRTRLAAVSGRPWVVDGSVAGEAFLSQDVYERELDRIFSTSWSVVAGESDLDRAGSFITSSLGGDAVVAVRRADGTVTVLLNSCRHLGHEVVQGRGEVRSLRCGHRGWTYDLDGLLVEVPGQDPAHPNFDFAAWSLVPVSEVVVYRGLVLARWETDERAAPDVPMSQHKRSTTTVEIAANWKCALESLLVLPSARWIPPNLVHLAEGETVVVVDPRGTSSTTVVVVSAGLTSESLASRLAWTVRHTARVEDVTEVAVCANTGEVCDSASGPDGCPLAQGLSPDRSPPRRPVPLQATSFYRWWLAALSPSPLD